MKSTFRFDLIKITLLLSASLLMACSGEEATQTEASTEQTAVASSSTATKPSVNKASAPLSLKILHLNDHHSHLDGVKGAKLSLGGLNVNADIGGYPLIVTKMNELSQSGNVLKLHAGDAMTGTMYYSLFRKEVPDALMMNKVCFDAFELGNHEFDDGNEQLAHFLDALASGSCGTQVLAANIEVPDTNPIAGKYQAYTTFEFDGQTVGLVGLDITTKTKVSSNPSADTEFFDETETAQKYIDELKGKGIDKIILLTHYTYESDQVLASNLTDVDVIVGGDSHSLLGDKSQYAEIGYATPEGDYPTIVKNKDGDQVCIVQAMDNARVVGELNVTFNAQGSVESCAGVPHLLIDANGLTKTVGEDKQKVALSEDEFKSVQTYLEGQAGLSLVSADADTKNLLKQFSDQVDVKMTERIGNSNALLCNERVPGQYHSSGATCTDGTDERAFLNKHGSAIAHIVSKAFYEMSLRADLTIQNSGGVRTTIDAGEISTGEAYNVLPFTNLLVNLDLNGQEIVNTLEDAIDFSSTSTGAFPSTYNLRFDIDMTKNKGNRVTNVEARRRGESTWSPIDLSATYTVVTNDYIASGQDGYTSFKAAYADTKRREDTGLLYTDSLINYIKALDAKGASLEHPKAEEMTVKNFIPNKN